MTTGVAAALLDNLTAAAELPALDKETRAGFLPTLYLRSQQLLTEQPAAVRFRVADAANPSDDGLDTRLQPVRAGNGSLYVMFTVLGGMAVLLRERRQWTLQRLMALPPLACANPRRQNWRLLRAWHDPVLHRFRCRRAAGMNFGSNPLALLSVMAAFVLCVTALTFALAPWMKSEGQARGLVLLLSLSLASIGRGLVAARNRARIHADAWAFVARRLGHGRLPGISSWYNGGFGDVLPEIGVLLAASAVLFAIGIRSFKYE